MSRFTIPSELRLERFDGTERYSIERAVFRRIRSATGDHILVRVETGAALERDESVEVLDAQPHWEIAFPLAASALLEPGLVLSLVSGYDYEQEEHLSEFYYCEFEDTTENRMEVLAIEGDRLHLRLDALVCDVRFSDDSKPKTRIVVESSFTLDPRLTRSSC